ncbi:hypothetical protein JXW62_05705 [Streptococcus suis]|uniref:hypothetical protein n=1 Tax=Streptococcus suis TaxID=1307 RepID=UPI001E4C3CEF|nr:hypothetical protein [Streptococcus suis]MCB2860632.1 hypothetical protein [Streptococcus suis]MCB2869169.1 hypothetical protein [Streptococcus suis]
MKKISIQFSKKHFIASNSAYVPIKYKLTFKRSYFDDLLNCFNNAAIVFKDNNLSKSNYQIDASIRANLFAILYASLEDYDEDFSTFFISHFEETTNQHYYQIIVLIQSSLQR